MEMRADLLIVGAGMVGSALALALKDSGLKILLLDGSPLAIKPFSPEAPFEPRVSDYTAHAITGYWRPNRCNCISCSRLKVRRKANSRYPWVYN